MNIKFTYLLYFYCLLFLSNITIAQKNNIQFTTKRTQFTAGENIVLTFKTNTDNAFQLYCSNSYGSTVLNSEVKNNTLSFAIPTSFSKKKGIVNWKLLAKENTFSGTFTIAPKETPASLETYIGPPSIESGGTDFTMFVVIPTDNLDNPLKENTEVKIQEQFLSKEKTTPIFTKNLIAFKTIFSPLKSGRIILSSSLLEVNSKEYDVNSMPTIGTNFKITAKRNHEYADGNQITTFATSVIKDKNKNVISDVILSIFLSKIKKEIF